MIISASRRTDIPGHYPEWMKERLKEGYVLVGNPRFPDRITQVFLDQEQVECIVFWTKFPGPMLNLALAVKAMGYQFYVQCTVNPYGSEFEPGMLPLSVRLDALRMLSDEIGPSRIIWRYDPVIIDEAHPLDFHLASFSRTAEYLNGYVEKCIFSFVDIYRKGFTSAAGDDMLNIAEGFSSAAQGNRITLSTCAEEIDLEQFGISHGACIDPDLVKRIAGIPLRRSKDRSQRKTCRCIESRDIGTYRTCPSGCAYCYASAGRNLPAARK